MKEMVLSLAAGHYQKRAIDDSFSQELYDTYLDTLDNTKSYFLQSDIDAMSHWRSSLDEALKQGRVSFGFSAFNRLRDIRLQQLNKNIALLESDFEFNLDDKESLPQKHEDRTWLKSVQERDNWWRKRMEAEIVQKLLAGEELANAREQLLKRYQNERKFTLQTESRDVFSTYARVTAALFDPHTNYFSPSNSDTFNINMSLSLEGIGAVLQRSDDHIEVVRIVPGGPAAKQGELAVGDKIIAIQNPGDDEPTNLIGWRLDDAVTLIRGPKDSIASLRVIPGEASSSGLTKQIDIVRDKVKLEDQAAQKQVIEVPVGDLMYKVGVIDIPTFYLDFEALRNNDRNYRSTHKDVSRLMGELINDEGVDGVILDLRANGGGSLLEATYLSDMFINPGPVVQIRSSNGQIDRTQRSRRPAAYKGPLVVLIDRLSASASEIFAGAIQDYGRGVIVGSQSFGKGTVQTLQPLGKGQLKLTEAKFYRVSGDSTQNRGIIPDIAFPSNFDPEEIGESSNDNALPWDRIKAAPHRNYGDLSDKVVLLEQSHQQRAANDPDFDFVAKAAALSKRFRKENEQPLSLNLEERRGTLAQREQLQLELENQRRVAKGLEPYKDYSEYETASDNIDQDALPLAEKDPLLMEAGRIVADMVLLEQNPKVFAQQIQINNDNPISHQ
ncbi:carboxy terminal-processing peptidase [bacterium SCSIO 12696]|nr:carboxy terminal-processing peptidase [bacterium SCSIO 12696]